MKNIYKIFSFITILLLAISLISCNKKESTEAIASTNDYGNLEILNSSIKITQESIASRIKAEYLIENGGYKDDDEIIVMINLSDSALLDTYLENDYGYNSVSEFANSKKGKKIIDKLIDVQDNLIKELYEDKLIIDVNNRYQTITNAISVKTKYKYLETIENYCGVSYIMLNDTFNMADTEEGDSGAVTNVVDVYDTGIYKSDSVAGMGITGKGTSVAILDSGFDCSHEVFQRMPEGDLAFTQQDISLVLNSLNAKQTTKSLSLMDVYYSNKIPYVYDYADKDYDVFPYDSEHGTHVAGIIGGSSNVITGVAVDTQLVLMKVFSDTDSGANTDDILSALEDAVLLGVDCINMSLGSSCGFAREEDGSRLNEVYDKIFDSGINLLCAASNSYSAGFGGAQGDTNKVTNPDSGTVGSPSTYAAALSVASISGTKSKYLVANGKDIIFFKESNSIDAKENNFYDELYKKLIEAGSISSNAETVTLDYVTIPGVGLQINYDDLDLTGKVALIRRGDNTFEEKALNAKNAGAIACIIYNNIDGDIIMSMGKTDHIPTISISKSDGQLLASTKTGTITLSYNQQAGPFMSEFSSWGPTADLQIKPEITAHGGNIYSSVLGNKYDSLSGTSMACPNLCGVMVLIRQFINEKYPDATAKERSVLCNQYLMSTATIALNEEGNPYSPRKQGAGLASLKQAVTTDAFLTVDGIDKTKLELGDDKNRTGIYKMEFNLVNTSNKNLSYKLGVIGMTETVSTSDDTLVREMDQILNGNTNIEPLSNNGSVSGTTVMVNANSTLKIKVTYTLTTQDKKIIEELFPYGMYVEGYVTLESEDDGVNLNVPFLAYYGDWEEAPIFDKTYYEVESQAHDLSIDDEDKIKADYYATTPYGSYFYNYIIPLGTYLYDIDESTYDAIPASLEHIALSDTLGTIDGINAVYAGLLRNCKQMTFTIVDKVTGEVVYTHVDINASKSYSNGSSPLPYYEYLKIKSDELGLVNNRQYTFKMTGVLDYGDGGVETNVRNTFEFDFYLDNEAPVIEEATYEKVYDKTLKKDRYYVTLSIYDNHYAMSVAPVIFTSSSSYAYLSDNPIPIYSERNSTTKVKIEITDYLDDIYSDALITSAIGFAVDDYALNSNLYLCQLPGSRGDFKFTKDGTPDGDDLLILTFYEDEVIDLTKYLSTTDSTVDSDKAYLNHLIWESSNELVVTVKEGKLYGVASGKATITVSEAMDLKNAIVIVNVKKKGEKSSTKNVVENSLDNVTLDSVRFVYADTLFAYSRAAQTSEIGSTGSRFYMDNLDGGLSFYPGEKVQLTASINPWYAANKYPVSWSSSNPTVASVDDSGVVTGLKKGTTIIVMSLEGSKLSARIKVTIKSEFVIENRTLIAYKGLGGDVVVPDDEGIIYIGAYSFCLYDTDVSIEMTDEDYDANKIPSSNTTITSVTIPKGVIEIQKYAFYNCTGLKSVTFGDEVDYIREYAFYNDESLETIDFKDVIGIGAHAFDGCKKLNNIDTSTIFSMGDRCFAGCASLESVDLTSLRNNGKETFKDCTSLRSAAMNENTKLSYAMFVSSGLEEVDVYTNENIPIFCFAKCDKLASVRIYNDIYEIGYGAFSDCTSLTSFTYQSASYIGDQAFYNANKLESFTLPNNEVELGNYSFYKCESLDELIFEEHTYIKEIYGSIFENTKLTKFVVDANNNYYKAQGNYLLNKEGNKIIFALTGVEYQELTIDSSIDEIGYGAFTGISIDTLTITNNNLIIGAYSFANNETITTINLPATYGVVIGMHAFNYATSLKTINNLEYAKEIGDYAFANTKVLDSATIGSNVNVKEGAFYRSGIKEVMLGANVQLGLGAFQEAKTLETVNMDDNGGIEIGVACFANCISLKKIDLSKTSDTIADEAFYGCKALKSAILSNVKVLGDYVFADCEYLARVDVPVIEVIGEGAFGRYDSSLGAPIFSEITLPDTLTTIKDGAFLGNTGLSYIEIPGSVLEIGDYLFAYCTKLKEVVLPNTIDRIGKYMFAGCEILDTINLDNIKYIDNYAFTSCYLLENVNMPLVEEINEGAFANATLSGDYELPNLKAIGIYAFQNCTFDSFKAYALETINEGAFSNCINLKEFIFTENINDIGLYVFNGCENLELFKGLSEGVTFTQGEINSYAFLNKGVLYIVLENGKYELKAVPQNIDMHILNVVDGTVRIDTFAGNECENIYTIILPDGLKLIGNYAFYGYKNLTKVEFRSINAPALEDQYNYYSEITEEDPGYDKLHNQFDLFGYELYYYNFIDLVGKNDPIQMVVPANSDIVGYDSLVYRVYFGTDYKVSDYYAMSNEMISFIENYNVIKDVNTITLTYKTYVDNGLTAYNSIKDRYQDFGYTKETWNMMYETLASAKEVIKALEFNTADKKVKEAQKLIDNLSDTFDASMYEDLKALTDQINALLTDQKALLDLTKYNNLMALYQEYIAGITNEGNSITNMFSKGDK